ncbi:molybdopterin molybdenumtransferase MoeA [Rhodobacterales bacterium HKCCE3408]|nr:molybdopterin molybdenumtransferase MoeA [Rhodobacterales bacterium HKCCE3408]
MVDWSARSAPSPRKPTADSIWIGVARGGPAEVSYHRTRAAATDWLISLFEAEIAAGRRVLAGFDFPFAYPRGFARAVTGSDDPLGLWGAIAGRVEDTGKNANNRWDIARAFNRLFDGGPGPFWGCPPGEISPDLEMRKTVDYAAIGLSERRAVEARIARTQPAWKLYTTGSVGSQVLLGLPRLHQLRLHFGTDLAVSPFEPAQTPIVLAEIYPSMLAADVSARRDPDEILDAAQVRVTAEAFRSLGPGQLSAMLAEGDPVEGWILGLGHEEELAAGLGPALLRPPPLRDDCFALPPGVDWTPVAEAVERLKAALHPVAKSETVLIAGASGRILAADISARRSHPPHANSAVDGFGFAQGSIGSAPHHLPLVEGRAAAGAPFDGTVPPGKALRILTGAPLPAGVDTVVLEEDCTIASDAIAFRGPLRRGANTRPAGEDVASGAAVLPAGHRLSAPDLALLAATGHGDVKVFERLKVAVLSTGDELAEAGQGASAATPDANRPMLAALLSGWGHDVVDLGLAPDDADAVRAALDAGAAGADAILTSGGASAGDEDHVSALLKSEGHLTSWRIALKPGRPLALATWRGIPVFGLPGNPVAAFVCALLFARPALSVLAGGGWIEPQRFTVPAAFEKRKKPGRNEYLRARLDGAGRAEVFPSEGSGRISGLSWSTGLVELGPKERRIAPGDPVLFLPYAGFGI